MTPLASRVAALTGSAATGSRPVGGGSVCDAQRITLTDGRTVFAKTLAHAPADFFAAESAGLAALRATGTVAVPDVLATEPDLLALEWIEPGPASSAQAERLGRELAGLHSTPADSYGTPDRPCYLGPLPLTCPAEPVSAPTEWPAFHAEYRLLPFLRRAVDNGGIAPADARAVERLCARIDEVAGEPQPPVVIHGDLWSGNVHWSADGRARLIDPAAQGGHPETDLALLELFGCPGLPRILSAYEEIRPVPGRAARVPLHQLQHLLVHAAHFGGGYGSQCGAAARAALRQS
ncbi:fructosamine kinase family protein [Streptomyces gobiensis]|uniref:fructosamine kinase family protein n=1 Tax=Streptomyces gobiensis TaxID=2875706 RepID=UPI001E3E70B7|nr:fructosamine kinase family protein [Streptomyces gobiensis]UGY94679.1 fructosamine kinase family protein [Streptomyces gobiensis]